MFNPTTPINGVFPDLSFEAYALADGLNNTKMKAAQRSLWRFKKIVDNPDRGIVETQALMTGRQFHTLLLEPELFYKTNIVLDSAQKEELMKLEVERVKQVNAERPPSRQLKIPTSFSRAQQSYKDWRKEFDQGVEEIDADWFLQMSGMCEAIREYEEVWELICGSDTEVTVFGAFEGGKNDNPWTMQLKARLDLLKQGNDSVIDLKTTVNASAEPFAAHIQKYGYYKQLAFYVDVCRLAGLNKRRAGILAIEKEWPYECGLHWIPDEWLELGRREYRCDLFNIANAYQHDDWPRIGVAEIMPPAWVEQLLNNI